jgi:hypothetical protein
MVRVMATAVHLCLMAVPAAAEVWMVKAAGAWGCRDRGALSQARGAAVEGCIALLLGERLLDMAEVGVGFSDHVSVQRHDGSIVYVAVDGITPDPGIGSLSEDRPE